MENEIALIFALLIGETEVPPQEAGWPQGRAEEEKGWRQSRELQSFHF